MQYSSGQNDPDPAPGGRLALVAVNLPIRKVFNYRVPERLRGAALAGQRVAVKFRGKSAVGVILGFGEPERKLDAEKILEVEDVLDEEPLLDVKLLDLVLWASRYYMAPPGELLKAALPPGAFSRAQRAKRRRPLVRETVRPAGSSNSAAIKACGRTAAAVLGYLSSRGSATMEELRAGFRRSARPAVRRLVEAGLARVEEQGVERRPAVTAALSSGGQSPPQLTAEQRAATDRIIAAMAERKFKAFMLHGVTGSGKTEVYMAAIREALLAGREALVLVPEISLTPRLQATFVSRFGDEVAVLHSGLTDGEHEDEWRRIRGRRARIVVGARSAVFAPLGRPGLVVVDEEHDHSYKQDVAPRYNARDLALVRAKQSAAVAVLGSATPALESYHNAVRGKYELLEMRSRICERPLPAVEMLNLAESRERGQRGKSLSGPLREALLSCLAAGGQAILFINRRGFSPVVMCRGCGLTLRCRNCDITLTYHAGRRAVSCHYCGFESGVPEACSKCGGTVFEFFGKGTERVERECVELAGLAGLGEEAVERLDRDSVSSAAELARILEDFSFGKTRVLVGTQMVAKGHDFPNVTLVGVVMADLGLWMPDFRAAERMFNLLVQVSGRAGRGEKPGRVIIQTFQPEHYVFRFLSGGSAKDFYEDELCRRREAGYPPFSKLAAVHFAGNVEERVKKAAALFAEALAAAREGEAVEVLGPAPPPLGRAKGKWRSRIMLKSRSAQAGRDLIEAAFARAHRVAGVSVSVDVDPVNMM